MAHHSSRPDPKISELLKDLGIIEEIAGPTGRHPEGKLTPSDDGEIRIALGYTEGKVVLHFGTQVEWVGFTPEQAVSLAEGLVENAKAAREDSASRRDS